MKTELPCSVVRDLLPSYVENLTEEETAAAVRDHLDKCPDCRRRYEAMKEGAAVHHEDEKEVDYLKTVRKKSRKKMIIAAVSAAVLVLSAVFAQMFLIGTAADAGSTAAAVTPYTEFNSISLSFFSSDSAKVLTGVKIKTTDDVMDITARKVLVSPFHPAEEVSVSVNLAGIREVRAFGETVWQDGVIIEGRTNSLIRNKTEYAGNAPEVSRLTNSMNFDVPHTLELHTDSEPYGITIHFTDSISENNRSTVRGSAFVLLSLVDNLSEVHWDDPDGYSDSLTLTDAHNMLPQMTYSYNQSHGTEFALPDNIKDCSVDPYSLQILRNILGV